MINTSKFKINSKFEEWDRNYVNTQKEFNLIEEIP